VLDQNSSWHIIERAFESWQDGWPGGSAGLLHMPRHGITGPVIASGLRSRDQLGLTVEPSIGLRHPYRADAPGARAVVRQAASRTSYAG
jgi:hypothetical protein